MLLFWCVLPQRTDVGGTGVRVVVRVNARSSARESAPAPPGGRRSSCYIAPDAGVP
jgi:hypothetical protein